MTEKQNGWILTPEAFAKLMAKFDKNHDTEEKHIAMDRLMTQVLRSLGYGSGCDIYDNVDCKWYA